MKQLLTLLALCMALTACSLLRTPSASSGATAPAPERSPFPYNAPYG